MNATREPAQRKIALIAVLAWSARIMSKRDESLKSVQSSSLIDEYQNTASWLRQFTRKSKAAVAPVR
jgi:hypothetical protein